MQPENIEFGDKDISNCKAQFHRENQTVGKASTKISGRTTKSITNHSQRLPLPRDITKSNRGYINIFEFCTVDQDPNKTGDTHDLNNSESDDTSSNKFKYCREVIRPYLKNAPENCPDTDDLIIRPLDFPDLPAQDDFPDHQPCDNNDNPADNKTDNFTSTTFDTSSQTNSLNPQENKESSKNQQVALEKKNNSTVCEKNKDTSKAGPSEIKMSPKPDNDNDKSGKKNSDRVVFKLCTDPDSSPICVKNPCQEKQAEKCSPCQSEAKPCPPKPCPAQPCPVQQCSTQQCPTHQCTQCTSTKDTKECPVVYNRTSLYTRITSALCSTGTEKPKCEPAPPKCCPEPPKCPPEPPKCPPEPPRCEPKPVKCEPKCEDPKPCCPEIKRSLYEVITSAVCSECKEKPTGTCPTCPLKDYDPCSPCPSKEPCCPPKKPVCCPDPCAPKKPECPDPCAPKQPECDPCKPKPKPCSFQCSDSNIPTDYSFEELLSKESITYPPKPKLCTFERQTKEEPDPSITKTCSSEEIPQSESEHSLPTEYPSDSLHQEEPVVSLPKSKSCSYERLSPKSPDIPKEPDIPCPSRGQGISKQKLIDMKNNFIESHNITITTIKCAAEDIVNKVSKKTKEVTDDPEFKKKAKHAEDLIIEYDKMMREKAKVLAQTGSESVEVAKTAADDLYSKICETTEKVQEVCKSTREAVYEIKSEGINYFNRDSVTVNNAAIDNEPPVVEEEPDNIFGRFSLAVSGFNRYFISNDKSSSYDKPEEQSDSLEEVSYATVTGPKPSQQSSSIFSINADGAMTPSNLFSALKEKICSIFYETGSVSQTSLTSRTSSNVSYKEEFSKEQSDEEPFTD